MRAACTVIRLGLATRTRLTCSCKLREPGVDCCKRAQEATCPQELAAPTSARRQVIVEIPLIDFVHMQETIGGAIVESAVLNVLAENPDTLYVSATKEICTAMMVKVLRGVFVGLVVLLQHDSPQNTISVSCLRCAAFIRRCRMNAFLLPTTGSSAIRRSWDSVQLRLGAENVPSCAMRLSPLVT